MLCENGLETYKGATILEREANYYDDSDFFALVWDEARRKCEEVMVGSTRFGGGSRVVIDATDEVLEQALAYYNGLLSASAENIVHQTILRQRKMVQAGDEVEVVAGRKVPKGVVGRVEHVRPNQYDGTNPMITIVTAEGVSYSTYLNNVLRVVDEKLIEKKAREFRFKYVGIRTDAEVREICHGGVDFLKITVDKAL